MFTRRLFEMFVDVHKYPEKGLVKFCLVRMRGLARASRRLPPPRAGHRLAMLPSGRVGSIWLRRSSPHANHAGGLLLQTNYISGSLM